MNPTLQISKFIQIQVQIAVSIERVKVALNLISNSDNSHETPAVMNLLRETLETLYDLNNTINCNTDQASPHLTLNKANEKPQNDIGPEVFF